MSLPSYNKVPIGLELLAQLTSVAELAADAAAAQTLPKFRQIIDIENKARPGEFDPVTEADKAAERVIKQTVLSHFPDHGFFGEESAQHINTDQPLWVVDPIDGTRAFITGMPLWGTLIAVYDGQDVALGVLDQPFLKERYIGTPSGTALHTPSGVRQLQTRNTVLLERAIAQTTTPDMFKQQKQRDAFEAVNSQVSMMRYGGDCYCYALLAMGFVDIVIEADMQPYDIQALIPIVQGAGGIVSNWQGESVVAGGTVLACATKELHQSVLALIN